MGDPPAGGHQAELTWADPLLAAHAVLVVHLPLVLEAWGAWGEKILYGKKNTGVIRSTVVVAPDGKVQVARYNVKATGHVASLRKALGV